jgi:predicted nucleic acid-binding protein
MGNEVLSQKEAWSLYDEWLQDGGASYLDEPPSVAETFRSFTQSKNVVPKDWADSYLAAFASALDLCLVTFDKGFEGKLKDVLILRP